MENIIGNRSFLIYISGTHNAANAFFIYVYATQNKTNALLVTSMEPIVKPMLFYIHLDLHRLKQSKTNVFDLHLRKSPLNPCLFVTYMNNKSQSPLLFY